MCRTACVESDIHILNCGGGLLCCCVCAEVRVCLRGCVCVRAVVDCQPRRRLVLAFCACDGCLPHSLCCHFRMQLSPSILACHSRVSGAGCSRLGLLLSDACQVQSCDTFEKYTLAECSAAAIVALASPRSSHRNTSPPRMVVRQVEARCRVNFQRLLAICWTFPWCHSVFCR